MTHELIVRPAGIGDAAAIARVHLQAWRESYAHLLPAETLAGLELDARQRRWRGILAAAATSVWVACDAEVVVGWASSGAGRDPDGPRPLELMGIYVLASHYGTGAGQLLLEAAVGGSGAYLWIAENNPRASAFYRKHGFTADGTRSTAELASVPVRTVRLVR
ncbi:MULTISPECIES: GNAT family N-acetyltransferase [Arthrobacter]|uniref:GNAT family N-acetyltransferase n=1 Tax=Arthrobacter oryzae TaxID=409290 RepID=A0A3N0BK99_9MICC|nr:MULTISPECIES: GNAT family N-acetyltransferase [Arthrobacter]QYF89416.1 GNAT family N-acetyltransferase [Arthrobacter sp. PAMC25284]RNL48776.1 GNAT family N-acetyltransferase [Arthrobacter oryzae]